MEFCCCCFIISVLISFILFCKCVTLYVFMCKYFFQKKIRIICGQKKVQWNKTMLKMLIPETRNKKKYAWLKKLPKLCRNRSFFRYLCGICVKSERSLLYSYRVATTFLIIFCSFDLQLVCPIFWVYSLNVAACIITASFV